MATTIAEATTEKYDLENRAKTNLSYLSSVYSDPKTLDTLKSTAQEQNVSLEQFTIYVQNTLGGKGNDSEYITILEVTTATLSKLNVGTVTYDSTRKSDPPYIIPFSTISYPDGETRLLVGKEVLVEGDINADDENPWAEVLNETGNQEVKLEPSDPNSSGLNLNSVYTLGPQNSGGMHKIFPQGNSFREIEIYPPLRKPVETRPFLIKMLDTDFKNAGIYINSDLIVWGISLTPTPGFFSISSSKIINRYQTMTRWVEEHWGDDLDVVNFSGSSFSFFAYHTGTVPDVGLTNQYSNSTAAFRIIKELETLFRYNGLIFQDEVTYDGLLNPSIPQSGESSKSLDNPMKSFLDTDVYFKTHHPLTGLVKERLYLNIYFDYVSFLGYFESFDVVEDADKPYQLTYNAIFRSEKTKWHQGSLATVSP
jgi:hypothetical protein